ncbi:MAG: hypothetical protein SRB1_01195 [Desulfobacteraceae bacterium Eth-SRB1]|nr:MAG: hypothetical protein SRB1_01195 [Desulfobacteraceae bacterium Eth-SRB1]
MRNRTTKIVTIYLLTIFFLLFLNFLLPRLLPGDVILAMYSGYEVTITDELYNELVQLHGLDKPLHVQFFIYLVQLAHEILDIHTSAMHNNHTHHGCTAMDSASCLHLVCSLSNYRNDTWCGKFLGARSKELISHYWFQCWLLMASLP